MSIRHAVFLSFLSFSSLTALGEDFPKIYDTEKGAPMSAEEAAATMELPKGFKCVVFAAEPDVRQPIGMAWDAKGRLWVAENYTFAETPMRWDTKLRDRVIILEDKDGDGKHDGRKVFWEGGSYLTSVETGYGGVWVLHNGTLSFIADKNGDDAPDGEPEVLLDGFNVKTIGHNIVNGLRWGPDGWLYGRHGITDTSSVGAPGTPQDKRTKLNCAMWRFHPTRKVFEVVAHGGTNSWGHDWNSEGELFMINTVIGHLWHVIPGAYYRRMFGTHLNPHVYEVIEQTADHFHWDTGAESWSDIRKLGVTGKTHSLGGGHAHVGMLIYQGGTWPKEYHGAVLTCNLHGNRINVDKLERQGCGYVGKHAPDFMQSKDKWFRGIDLLTGPDGNVFVSDWSDSGECHDNDGVHRSSGRIYKIVYGEPKKAEPINVAAMKDEELVKLINSSNNWWSRFATAALHEKFMKITNEKDGEAKTFFDFAGALLQLNSEKAEKSEAISTALLGLRMSQGIPASNDLDSFLPIEQIQKDEGLRALWLTSLSKHTDGEEGEVYEELRHKTLNLYQEAANTDKSGLVRLHLASALQRLPLDARWPIATALAKHEEDANDRQQPLMIWYGIEPAVAAEPMKGVELIREAKIPTVRRLVARRIAEMIEDKPEAVDALVALMAKQSDLRDDVLAGMAAGLDGFSSAKKPKGWDEFLRTVVPPSGGSEPAKAGTTIQNLSVVFGSGRAADELIAIVKNADGDANARLNAFKSLTRSAKPELLAVIRAQVNDKVLATAARGALAAYDDPSIPKQLLGSWPVRSEEQQAATVATLTSRASYAKELLEAVKAKKVPAAAITPFQARQIRNLGDESVTKLLTEAWGEIRETPEAKKAEFAKWEGVLKPEALTKADKSKGRMIFMAACSACHKMYGQGGAIAPELTGSDRRNLKYLLENILDPNAVVPADFRVSVFQLKDGRTITGVIPEQTERTLTVQTPVERLTIERTQIVKQEQLTQSLMPEGLLAALGEENVMNLIAYLMGEGQVEMPK
ncbi:PVC-type heme-binding CxxCH protein [Prosthecobacter sp.]|uniref:PVC-type heme-binding CxxCH protein n=1 Tax=Prosthecobacter sp. TaxID=1965333 RepID=UPI002AB7FCF9|nr:PVC-type heme-binding CxxCH protein [Prosthecobacter sp.]MDZ4405060.1 PVC-type heme-binding CxxCH protein [Prosthecobacter sp.]